MLAGYAPQSDGIVVNVTTNELPAYTLSGIVSPDMTVLSNCGCGVVDDEQAVANTTNRRNRVVFFT